MKKKGLELSATVIVLLIISIIMFISAFALVRKFFGEATSIRQELEKAVQRDIERILRQGTQVLTIPFNKQSVKRGTDAIFGLGIRNVLGANKTFCTYTFFDSAYQPNEQPLGRAYGTEDDYDAEFIQQKWVGGFAYIDEPGPLKNNEFKIVPLRIKANNNMAEGIATLKGTYVFNVCVYTASNIQGCTSGQEAQVCRNCVEQPLLCKQQQQLNPNNFVYTGKVLKVFVEVV